MSAPEVKTYRRHRCDRRHRNTRTLLACAYPRAAWIVGRGPFAVLAWCHVLTISLHPDLEAARKSLAFIDSTRCGGRCTGRHEIVRVILDGDR